MLESIYKPKQENEYFEVYRKNEILMAIKTNKNMIKLKNQFTEKFKQHHHIYTKLKGLNKVPLPLLAQVLARRTAELLETK